MLTGRASGWLPLLLAVARFVAEEVPNVIFNGKLDFEATVPCAVAFRAAELTLHEWFKDVALTVTDPCSSTSARQLRASDTQEESLWKIRFQIVLHEDTAEQQNERASHYSALNSHHNFVTSIQSNLKIKLDDEYAKTGQTDAIDFYNFVKIKLKAARVGKYVSIPGSLTVTAEGYSCEEVQEATLQALVRKTNLGEEDVTVTVECDAASDGEWKASIALEKPEDKVSMMIALSKRSYWVDGVSFELEQNLQNIHVGTDDVGQFCCLAIALTEPGPPVGPDDDAGQTEDGEDAGQTGNKEDAGQTDQEGGADQTQKKDDAAQDQEEESDGQAQENEQPDGYSFGLLATGAGVAVIVLAAAYYFSFGSDPASTAQQETEMATS